MRSGRTTSAWAGWVVFAGTMAILDVVVIYALIVHGRELADR